jgi:hypothetical protein
MFCIDCQLWHNIYSIVNVCISALRHCTGNNSIQDAKAQDSDMYQQAAKAQDSDMYQQAAKVFVCDKCDDYVFLSDTEHQCSIQEVQAKFSAPSTLLDCTDSVR